VEAAQLGRSRAAVRRNSDLLAFAELDTNPWRMLSDDSDMSSDESAAAGTVTDDDDSAATADAAAADDDDDSSASSADDADTDSAESADSDSVVPAVAAGCWLMSSCRVKKQPKRSSIECAQGQFCKFGLA
jgi:hypothetical protein